MLDGVFTVLSEVDQGSSGSGSCTVAGIEAAHVPHGCSSSSMIASTRCGGKETDMKGVQFFVNHDQGSTVVRSSLHCVMSDVLCLSSDEYAVYGTGLVKSCTISQNGIGNGSNVQVLRRLRGGAGACLDIPGQRECKVCHATRCWPARKRCYMCDAPRDTVPNNPPKGPLGRPPPQSRSSGPPTRSSRPRHIPPRYNGNGDVPSSAAGVGPSPGGNECGKKGEAGELLQALSLLQHIMTPEDFAKVPGVGGSQAL